jgi:hypothetical protein
MSKLTNINNTGTAKTIFFILMGCVKTKLLHCTADILTKTQFWIFEIYEVFKVFSYSHLKQLFQIRFLGTGYHRTRTVRYLLREAKHSSFGYSYLPAKLVFRKLQPFSPYILVQIQQLFRTRTIFVPFFKT